MGAKVVDDEISEQLRVDAVNRDKDPLFDFPNDVVYFTEEQCDQQIKYWSKVSSLRKDIPVKALWDEKRKKACLGGFGDAARRCSMNNDLWEMWLNNPKVTLDTVKRRIKADIVRSQLYPEGYPADKPPPRWYIKKLQESGEYERIVEELRGLTRHEA